jgi:hypothetical protein
MPARTLFQQALTYMEAGECSRSESLLRHAIVLAETERDELTRGSALCCLADMLLSQERQREAIPLLEHLSLIDCDDNSLDEEIDFARDMLQRLDPAPTDAMRLA